MSLCMETILPSDFMLYERDLSVMVSVEKPVRVGAIADHYNSRAVAT